MSCKIDTNFANVSQIGQTLLTSETRGKPEGGFWTGHFWASEGWFDVNIPTSGAWGGDFATLRPVEDFSYTLGQVWEAARKDWVWETGSSLLLATIRLIFLGVYVNGALKETGDATYAHHYNYPLGRVIFDNPLFQQPTVYSLIIAIEMFKFI